MGDTVERPILFSGPMVRAILDGRKTQTRRVIKPQPHVVPFSDAYGNVEEMEFWRYGEEKEDWPTEHNCPYGKPGDELWVRETFAKPLGGVVYRADVPDDDLILVGKGRKFRWKPSIFMPRWASRIQLQIINVKVERLQDISEEDARAEGGGPCAYSFPNGTIASEAVNLGSPHRNGFRNVWIEIDGKTSWCDNPWVWVIEFRRLENER